MCGPGIWTSSTPLLRGVGTLALLLSAPVADREREANQRFRLDHLFLVRIENDRALVVLLVNGVVHGDTRRGDVLVGLVRRCLDEVGDVGERVLVGHLENETLGIRERPLD